MRRIVLLFGVLVGLVILTGICSASQINLDNVQMNAGDTKTMTVILDKAPSQGIQGYAIYLEISQPSVAEISSVTFPSAFSILHSTPAIPFTRGDISAVDLTTEHYIPGNAQNVLLATITIHGLAAGSTILKTTLTEIDGLNGDDLKPVISIASPTITITNVGVATVVTPVALPSQGRMPTSPGNNGKYSDLNGDGVVASADVSLYFTNFDWIQNNAPVALFDYNNNGIIDFGDIVTLNEKVQAYR